MAIRTLPGVEGLEVRTLLSALSYSLTTDQSIYQVGQSIELTFTETNVSDQPVTVAVSPTDFTVSQNGTAIWQSDPTDAGQSPTSETLLPGQSVSQTASWDGIVIEEETVVNPGASPISTTYDVNNFGTFTVSDPNGPQGLNATFQITDPIMYTLTTDQSVYQLGQPVQILITESNTSDQSVSFAGDGPSELNILYNGTSKIADSFGVWLNAFPDTINAGQTFMASPTWNGIPDSGADFESINGPLPEPVPYANGVPTGTFLVEYSPGDVPPQMTTTFQIVPPAEDNLVTSVTTDQAVYSPGQPVTMTFTETNDGTQPVPVIIGSPEFQVMQNGTVVWEPVWDPQNPLTQQSWLTLQPGQSYTQTATWDGIPNQGSLATSTGLFSVSDNFDPNGEVATFQISSQSISSSQNPSNAGLSDVVAGLSTGRDRYCLGERVRISLNLKDVDAKHVALKPSRSVAQVTIFAGSSEVYRSSRVFRSLALLNHGSAEKLTMVWSGKANQSGITKLSPGAYTIQINDDGYVATETVRISGSDRYRGPKPLRAAVQVLGDSR